MQQPSLLRAALVQNWGKPNPVFAPRTHYRRNLAKDQPNPLWFSAVESREAAERFEHAEEAAEKRESFGKRVAVLVAVLAAMLALAGLGANRAQEEVLLAQVQASDTWNEYQANSLKKHINEDMALSLKKQGATDDAQKLIDANNNKYIPQQQALMPKA